MVTKRRGPRVRTADGTTRELNGDELPGPDDPPKAAQQWAWLEQRMQSSTADYLWVGAHCPGPQSEKEGGPSGFLSFSYCSLV